jgi:hypothetical protein
MQAEKGAKERRDWEHSTLNSQPANHRRNLTSLKFVWDDANRLAASERLASFVAAWNAAGFRTHLFGLNQIRLLLQLGFALRFGKRIELRNSNTRESFPAAGFGGEIPKSISQFLGAQSLWAGDKLKPAPRTSARVSGLSNVR